MKPVAKTFRFLGSRVHLDTLQISFAYQIDFSNRTPLRFEEKILLPKKPPHLSKEVLKKFLEPLHLILGISYYKLYCPLKIRLPFRLSPAQADFWNTIYRKGLGEFLYRNKLDPKKIANFPHANARTTPVFLPQTKDRILLGVGGGKDSIVAAELLRGFSVTSFLVETQKEDPLSRRVMKKIGNPLLMIRRVLDPKIFELYEGAYNGHVPVSAMFAFLGLLSSALYGYRYVVVGNEHSSNFGNVRYRGEVVNHQWSKSVEFETMLQTYTREFITPDITYFSLLRPFHELRVVRMFAQYKKYFSTFSSCNRNFNVFQKRGVSLWCGECPKCAFVFLTLAAFFPKQILLEIFQKNLLADEDLIPLFCDILGFGKLKPFDCVGTFEEAQAALFLASKRFAKTVVVKTFLPRVKRPKELVRNVMKTTSAPTMPTLFRLLGMETACLLGYGKEGCVTERYLKKKYPALKIGILDQRFDRNYLKKQERYDIAVKTPGIPKNKVTIPCVTATNLFFAQNKNFTIGVTGSKGKSTTATLMYEMLKVGGKKVRLIGNIGTPMLEVLLKKIDPREIFVIELSSYMLEDIEYSPNIALLLNLFPEHMNYHGSVENYYAAKQRIFAFQKPGDVALRPPFPEPLPLKTTDIPLLGPHNVQNIKAAVKVARCLGVSDAAIRRAIKNFRPLPHRLGRVGTFRGITFYDDAISTTPESTMMALRSLKNVSTIFLGGEDRGYDFRKLEKMLRARRVKNIVLFPESGKRVLTSRRGLNVFETRQMKEAVQFAFTHAPKGSICLLSTASPSYSLWKNFEEKGDEFQKWVRKC